jgi:hypothetical protein
LKAIYKCPHCTKETDFLLKQNSLPRREGDPETFTKERKYWIVHRIKNQDGTINWFNLFRMPMKDIAFLACIIILLFGFWQMNTQCKLFLSDPCGYAANTSQCIVLRENLSEILFSHDGFEINLPKESISTNP